ncbi:hypothetical protein H0E87_030217 [Populus deltoides]|uniref:Uncharacterized protein n=1 Tax=Populus deltoides TaxID=3696 RepID=A0A8T2WJ00_POPDE|nr:hypothetical protein H0E87_030217 [Populus deltoides]
MVMVRAFDIMNQVLLPTDVHELAPSILYGSPDGSVSIGNHTDRLRIWHALNRARSRKAVSDKDRKCVNGSIKKKINAAAAAVSSLWEDEAYPGKRLGKGMESCGVGNSGGNNSNFSQEREHLIPSPSTAAAAAAGHQEVTIRIIGSAENDRDDESNASPNVEELPYGQRDGVMESNVNSVSTVSDGSSGIDIDSSLPSSSSSSSTSYQRYDIQNLARWIEHWHRNGDLLYLLVLLLPTTTPPLWRAVFIVIVNDGLVREVAMVFKMLLLYYKNGRGHNYRKQSQMLTLVENLLILYRAVLPTPVWYLFFLNKEYGSFFSSLITGLYLTVKLTTVLWKVQLFFTAWRTLPLKEMYYGSYATSEHFDCNSFPRLRVEKPSLHS